MNEVKVVWMDETVKIYREVVSAAADERGQLVLSWMERIDRSRQGTGRGGIDHKQRTIRIPLVNVRWWGQPGQEVAW